VVQRTQRIDAIVQKGTRWSRQCMSGTEVTDGRCNCTKRDSMVREVGEWNRSQSSCAMVVKGTVARDFRPLVFCQTVPLGPLIHGLKRFRI
jgi:hypothetical protein